MLDWEYSEAVSGLFYRQGMQTRKQESSLGTANATFRNVQAAEKEGD